MTRLLGIVVLAVLLTGLAACSQKTDNGGRSANQSPGSGTASQRTTAAPESVAGDDTQEGTKGETEAAPPDASGTWDYVALGDSLAVGVGARRGYVDRYADHLRTDTGARVELTNLGVSGQTSPQLLQALRNDTSMRRALRGAEVVTYNIGINDLGRARGSYEAGTCGGTQGKRCLRAAVEEFEGNWDEITAEILNLRSPDETIIRTTGLGYTPLVGKDFEPYLKQANQHIAASADESGIPCTQVTLGDEGLGPDDLHPNDGGYEAIADGLQRLGYEPLYSR